MIQLPRGGVEAPRLLNGASPDCIVVVVVSDVCLEQDVCPPLQMSNCASCNPATEAN